MARYPRVAIGLAFVVGLILVAALAPIIAPSNPVLTKPALAYQPPGAGHLLGTDNLGRDVLSRVIWGSRVSLEVGIISVTIGLVLGGGIGIAAGWRGGWIDLTLMRGIDALLAFPATLLAIAITSALGAQIQNAMIAIGVVNIPVFARLARGQVLQVRANEYIIAARVAGGRASSIIRRHVLPNIANPLIVQATLTIALAILAEATLSFLGLGVQPPTPSWGFDVNTARGYLTNNFWWMAVGPGCAILVTVTAFNFLGDAVRDALDPRLRER
ncbi:MAG: ABC transporter permease [Chloroflexi bacterium]|nr:ABC transporter permease [Chloroflexota bacterium]